MNRQAIEAQADPISHLIALGGDHGITLPLLGALSTVQQPSLKESGR
jgi:arginase family enzyme